MNWSHEADYVLLVCTLIIITWHLIINCDQWQRPERRLYVFMFNVAEPNAFWISIACIYEFELYGCIQWCERMRFGRQWWRRKWRPMSQTTNISTRITHCIHSFSERCAYIKRLSGSTNHSDFKWPIYICRNNL